MPNTKKLFIGLDNAKKYEVYTERKEIWKLHRRGDQLIKQKPLVILSTCHFRLSKTVVKAQKQNNVENDSPLLN